MVIVGTPPQASEHYPPPLPRVKGLHAITASGIPGGPCRCWFSRRDRWRSGCNGGSLQGVRADTRRASFRRVRHGAGQGCGEPRSAGHRSCNPSRAIATEEASWSSLRQVRWHHSTQPFGLGLRGCWMACTAMPRSWRSPSKTPRNSAPLSVWPPDDDREGLEDALEGRPHVAHRRGGDELGGSRFRDRVADRQLIDPATGGIAPEQGIGLHPLSGWVETTALLSAVAWRRAVDRSGWICWRQTLVFLEIFEDPPDRHADRTARFPPACNLFLRLSPACRQCHMCLIVCSKLRPMAGRWPRLHRGR